MALNTKWQIEVRAHGAGGTGPVQQEKWAVVHTMESELCGRDLAEWVERYARAIGAPVIPESRLVRVERTVVNGTFMRRYDQPLAPLAKSVEG